MRRDEEVEVMEAGTVKKIAIAILIPLLLIFLVAVGAAIWYFVIYEPPERVMEKALVAARSRDEERFKEYFSKASVRALEGSWTGESYGRSGSWGAMMAGIMEPSGAPPTIVETELTEEGDRAKVKLRLRDQRRTVYFINEDGDWRFDVLSGVNVGVSEEARAAKKVEIDPEKAKKEEKFSEEPKKRGWWKKD